MSATTAFKFPLACTSRLHADTIEHLTTLHGHRMYGFLAVGRICKSSKKSKGHWRQYLHLYEDIAGQIDYSLHIEGASDIYISAHSFITRKRSNISVYQYRSVFVDLDCYKVGYNAFQLAQELERNWYGKKIPEPTLTIFTGQGLSLWYVLKEPVFYKDKKGVKYFQAVQKKIIDELKCFGADDVSDGARVMRLAGTINSKTGKRAEIISNSRKFYELGEIAAYFNNLKVKETKDSPKEKKQTTTSNQGRMLTLKDGYYQGKIWRSLWSLFEARVKDLEKLCELRDWDVENYREKILFLYRYWNCYLVGTEKAYELTNKLNRRFKKPLEQKEVDNATYSAEKAFLKDENGRKVVYSYTNKKLVEWLDISLEEQKHLVTIISKKEKARRNNEYNKAKFKAQRRNQAGRTKREQAKFEKLVAVYLYAFKKGYTSRQIADKLQVSQQLVCKYRKELLNPCHPNLQEIKQEVEKLLLNELKKKHSTRLTKKQITKTGCLPSVDYLVGGTVSLPLTLACPVSFTPPGGGSLCLCSYCTGSGGAVYSPSPLSPGSKAGAAGRGEPDPPLPNQEGVFGRGPLEDTG